LFAHSFVLVLIISASIALAMGLLSGPVATRLFSKPELAPLLRVLAFSIVPFSLLQLMGESVRATGRAVLSTALQTALAPVLALAFISLAPGQDAISNTALCYTLAYFAAMITAIFFQSPRARPGAAPTGKSDHLSPRQLLITATPVAWVTIFSVWLGFSETLLLGLFRTADEVGYYAASLRLVLLVNFLLVAFNGVLAPKFAVLQRQGAIRELIALARRATLVMLALSCPIFLMLFLFPSTLLAWFGEEFTAASLALVILAAGQLVNIATGPVGILMLMTGNAPAMQRHLITTVLVNLALACLLIPTFGLVGAACSAATAMIVLNLLLLRSVYGIFGKALEPG
jgi:O-antigen/teichoic acid export membrane protein